MKSGDLVTLKEPKDFPDCAGSLAAVKFYKRMINRYEGKLMLVLEMINDDSTALIFVDGYIDSLREVYLRVVSESR
jgi:hypothetical protein